MALPASIKRLLTPVFTRASGDHREPRHEGILGDQLTNGYAGINKTSCTADLLLSVGTGTDLPRQFCVDELGPVVLFALRERHGRECPSDGRPPMHPELSRETDWADPSSRTNRAVQLDNQSGPVGPDRHP
jgi:hypothetical protein